MGVTHVLDLFCEIRFLSVGGGIDLMITQTLFSEEMAVTSRTVKSQDILSGDRRDTSCPGRDDACCRRLCNWFHSVDKNDRFLESL